jgi:pimeloyl-ACP methyl ester carboxylesterase
MRLAIASITLALCCLALSCGDSKKAPVATVTPRALPSPVAVPPATEPGFTLGDPKLEPLPSATVDDGQLGGMVYQIEMPDQWNGRLVMYTHGNDINTELQVYPPANRRWLIEHGYGWASSSYTVNVAYVSGIAADETAALWDAFVQKHGRPAYSYAMGDSMGGAAAFTAAERYPDRYDGALPLCADAPPSRVEGDFFYAAAYSAGVTQAQYDASDMGTILDTRVKPALRDPAIRQKFDALWTDLSGGTRPFVSEGVSIYYPMLWTYAISNILSGADGNDAVQYKLGPSAGVSSDDFNRGVIRVKTVPGADKYDDVNRISGDIKIPTLTVQPTGDALTVFSSSQELRRRAEAKGKGKLLVQRAIEAPQHCFDGGMSGAEIDESFQALVDWVEQGKKPEGEDLLGDVSNAGAKFTRSPRLGSDAASRVPGADQRVTLGGTVTLDGQPVDDGFMWAMVSTNGLIRPCSFQRVVIDAGRYRLTVASDAETPGCGAPGTRITLGIFTDDRFLSEQTFAWPSTPGDATFDVTFSRAHPPGAASSNEAVFGTHFSGMLLDAKSEPLGPGTAVDAYIGSTRCGAFSVPPVKMIFDDTQGYTMNVASPDAVPGCTKGATISFHVNGKDTGLTGVNDLIERDNPLDLREK